MKRILLWTINLIFLMALSASYATPQTQGLVALGSAELGSVTAGICDTCDNNYPTLRQEGWDLIKSQESAHTVTKRSVVRQLVNNSPSVTAEYTFNYNNECSYKWTGGSASVGASIGISLNRTYHCAGSEVLHVKLPPRTSATLYQGTKRYYITQTYRHYLVWSDGYREITGRTETFRKEYTYSFREVR